MSDTQSTQIEGWAIIDLFGHTTVAGYVSTVTLGAVSLFRLDVPAIGDTSGYTRFLGIGAIYSMTMVTEELAREAIESIRPRPVSIYLAGLLRERDASDDDDPEEFR